MPHRTRHARPVAACALLAALGLLQPRPARGGEGAPPAPRFDSKVEVVNLNVTVTDGRRRNVGDLTPADFVVLEDGVPQPLSLFNHERIPISLAILIDVSASMEGKLKTAQAAAMRLVSALGPEDEAEVVPFNHRALVTQDFTPDHDALRSAIEGTRPDGATALYNALYVALRDLGGRVQPGQLRRQAVVVLSDGEDTSSVVSEDQVLDLAKRSNISVYTISLRPRDPQSLMDLNVQSGAFFLASVSRATGADSQSPSALSQLERVYDRIAEELHTQYSLGYVPTNGVRDGKWRKLAVLTPARGSCQVRCKLGYFAPLERLAVTR